MIFNNRFQFGDEFLSDEEGTEIISVIADSDFEDDKSREDEILYAFQKQKELICVVFLYTQESE